MNLSISNIAWNQEEDTKVYEIMEKYKFRGLEIAPTRFFENPYEQKKSALDTIKQSLSEHNVELVAMQSLHFGKEGIKLFGTDGERLELLEYTKKAIEFASALGIQVLVFGSPKLRVMKSDEDMLIAIEFFTTLGDYAAKNNVYLCIEANPKEYNTNFINTTKQAIDLVENVNSEGFRLHLDTGTLLMNGEVPSVIQNAGKYLKHVHISEPFLNSINDKNQEFHKELKKVLNGIGYDQWVSIEMRKVSETENLENVESCLKYVGSIFGG